MRFLLAAITVLTTTTYRPILNHDGRRRLLAARAKIDDRVCFLSTANIIANTANLFVVEDSHRDLGRHSRRPLSEERWTLNHDVRRLTTRQHLRQVAQALVATVFSNHISEHPADPDGRRRSDSSLMLNDYLIALAIHHSPLFAVLLVLRYIRMRTLYLVPVA